MSLEECFSPMRKLVEQGHVGMAVERAQILLIRCGLKILTQHHILVAQGEDLDDLIIPNYPLFRVYHPMK